MMQDEQFATKDEEIHSLRKRYVELNCFFGCLLFNHEWTSYRLTSKSRLTNYLINNVSSSFRIPLQIARVSG